MFYPEKRDGFARTGKIEVNGRTYSTPVMLEVGSIPEWNFSAPPALKFIDSELYDRLRGENGDVEVLPSLHLLTPRQLVQVFDDLTENGFSIKPLYAAASALPSNVSLLIYLGVDIVDNILAISKAYNGFYFLGELEVEIGRLKELPCSCIHCRRRVVEEVDNLTETVAMHNTEMLRMEVEKCRRLILGEELRNYVEAKVKLNPEFTAALRLSDTLRNRSTFPRFRKSRCNFSAAESSSRFEVRYFLERALECYEPFSDTVLLLPCTARKPYLTSRTHRALRSRVRVNINEIIISSPLVVPREFELLYPAVNYDTPVTGHWSEEEVSFVAEWLRRFIDKGGFKKVVAHVTGGYRRVVERAEKGLKAEVVYTAEKDVLSEDSLNSLKKEIRSYGKVDLYRKMLDHMLRYQFGISWESARVAGRYPELELIEGKKRIARVDTNYGMLDIYESLARKLLNEEIYTVKIGDFDVKGTIFAGGVLEADERIRPNDVIVFHNEEIYGVGIASMSGREMVESQKGMAVRVKRKFRF